MHYNLRLWLVESFVGVNQWDLVEEVLGRLYQHRFDLTLHRPLLIAMQEALAWFIEPLYAKVVKSSKFLSAYAKPMQPGASYCEYRGDERPDKIR